MVHCRVSAEVAAVVEEPEGAVAAVVADTAARLN